jgi:hypothetical protein
MSKKVLSHGIFKSLVCVLPQLSSNFFKIINRLRFLVSLGIFSMLCFVTTDMAQVSGVSVVAGWNLLGNGSTTAIQPSSIGDKTIVTSIWKWNKTTKVWAFYSPSYSDGGASYAASQQYEFLSSINPGDGYWVNAISTFTIPLGSGSFAGKNYLSTGSNALISGWQLIATGDSLTPSIFNQGLANNGSSSGSTSVPTSFETLWAWDAGTKKWLFYSPSLEAQGGTALSSYISTNQYEDFTQQNKSLGQGVGFWVNGSTSSSSSSSSGTSSSTSSGSSSTPPATPVIIGVIPGDQRVSVAFNFAGGNLVYQGATGFSAATSYVATCTSSDGSSVSASGINPIPVSGLTNGVSYTCKVTAGVGSLSATSTASLATIPNAGPTQTTASDGKSIVLASTPNTTFANTYSTYDKYCNYINASTTGTGMTTPPTLGGSAGKVYGTSGSTSGQSTTAVNNATITCSGSTRTIKGNAVPDHAAAAFFTNGLSAYSTSSIHTGVPNYVGIVDVNVSVSSTPSLPSSYQTSSTFSQTKGINTQSCYTYNQTSEPSSTNAFQSAAQCTWVSIYAYFNNSVKVEPGTAETYSSSSSPKTTYITEGKSYYQDVGLDPSNAHNQPTGGPTSNSNYGYYHYHGMPEAFISRIGKGNSTMTLVGFANDGFPVYARYGYTKLNDVTGGVSVMKSNYRLRTADEITKAGYTDRPATTLAPIGSFAQDWVYDAASVGGDLDACNGRIGVTPESPNTAVYHYFITETYPFISRCVYGTASSWANTKN